MRPQTFKCLGTLGLEPFEAAKDFHNVQEFEEAVDGFMTIIRNQIIP